MASRPQTSMSSMRPASRATRTLCAFFTRRRRYSPTFGRGRKQLIFLLLTFVTTTTAFVVALTYFRSSTTVSIKDEGDADGTDGIPYGGIDWDVEKIVVVADEQRNGSSSLSMSFRQSGRQQFAKQCSMYEPKTGSDWSVSIDKSRTDRSSLVRIIHRMWKTVDVPASWIIGPKSCRHYNPNWLYCHWTDDELLSFIGIEYPDFLPTYIGYRYPIQRADAARYFLLYHYAGVYLDLDIVCRRPFDEILTWATGSDVILADAEPLGVVSDFVAVLRRRDPFMRHVVAGLTRSAAVWYPLPYIAVMFATGPVYLSRRARDFNETTSGGNSGGGGRTSRLTVIPTHRYNGLYFGHLAGGSWHSLDGQLIWTVYRLRLRILGIVAAAIVGLLLTLAYRKIFVRRR